MTLGPHVPGYGNPRARIMVVGEAPGAKEEAAGRPFVGPAGNLLRELLLKAGINPDTDVYYSNICKHRPPGNDLSAWFSGSTPNETVLDGMAELQGEVERVNPNVIIPVGNYPLWAFYTREPKHIAEYRGSILSARKLARGKKLVPTYHPSFLLRGAWAEHSICVLDLKRARRESSSPRIRSLPWEGNLLLDPRGSERDVVRDRLLGEGDFITGDIEFIGRQLLCMSFTSGRDWAASIRIRSQQDIAFIQEILESGRPLCFQNAMFDCGNLDWHFGIDCFRNLRHDTMVGAYELNLEWPKDLGFLCSTYTEQPIYWGPESGFAWPEVKEILKKDPNLESERGREIVEAMLIYNARDAVVTHNIAVDQQPELDEDPSYRRAYQFDMRKIPHLWAMAKRGVRINHEKVAARQEMLEFKIIKAQRILNDIASLYDMGPVNVKSGRDMQTLLFDHLGIPRGRKTESGKEYSTDNIVLANALPKCTHEVQRKALYTTIEIRNARDEISKFCDVEWDDDGRGRTIYDPTKTGTRRLSSKIFFPTGKGSNMQNISTEPEVRDCFEADPGMEFAYGDLKGAEFLVVAELTQDPEMKRLAQMTIDGSGDVHTYTASYILHVPEAEVDYAKRFVGKRTRHSANYIIGWKELMEKINEKAPKTGVFVTAAEAKVALAGYKSLHPFLAMWWREVEMLVKSTRTLANLFGFKRVFHSLDLPVAVAFVPQSSIGDCLNFGLVACAEDPQLRALGFELLLQVHDAIGYQYPIANRYAVNSRVRQLMDVPMLIPKTGEYLHVPVEIQVGPTWGQLEVWKEDLNQEKAA